MVVKWAWRRPGHITELEARSIRATIRARTRTPRGLGVGFVHLADNQSALAVMAKSRSSSHTMNVIVERSGALLLAADSSPLYLYTDTDRNPADEGSRSVE